MCQICLDLKKEKFTPQEFWNNYRELLLTEDDDHWREVIKTLSETSEEYQKKLSSFWD